LDVNLVAWLVFYEAYEKEGMLEVKLKLKKE
jgi:hypothetical protein